MEDNEITKLFNQDIKEKKKLGRGIFSRASRKKGFKGGVRTAYDFMSNEERKSLNSEVKVYKMYISYDEFKELSKNEKVKILERYDEELSRRELCELWGVNTTRISDWRRRLGISRNNKTKLLENQNTTSDLDDVIITPFENLFNLKYFIKSNGSELKLHLLRIAEIMEDDKEYNLTLKIFK